MADKSNNSRFCIQFNNQDANHLRVINLLNEQGRHKAQFIAQAVLHYISCTNSPEITTDSKTLRQTIELVVRDYMAKSSHKTPDRQADNDPRLSRLRKSENITPDDDIGEIDDELISAITNSLDAFKK